jgi:hypothetical protein
MACTYKYNGKWYTLKQLQALPEFKVPHGLQQLQREFINNNTGSNTDTNINFFSVSPSVGVFTKYVQFKRGQLAEYRRRINNIERLKRQSGIEPAKLVQLNNRERELKLRVNGSYELGIKGIIQEIAELDALADINAVGYYVEKDLERLNKLAHSSDTDDLKEAQRLIDFYDLAGTFRLGIENPFFTQDEIFLPDAGGVLTSEIALSDTTLKQYREWRDRAATMQNPLDKRKQEVATEIINNDPSVENTYGGRRLSFEQIIKSEEGLKDTDWVSMWTMDITQGIFSNNGVIPQVMYSYLVNSFEKKLSWAREIEERIDKINPQVQRVLMSMKNGKYSLRGAGILGIKGASYQIFKEITKEGNETGGLVQRFTKEFFDRQSRAMNIFSDRFDTAKNTPNLSYAARSSMYNAAFEELKKWRRNNSIIMDVNKLPEIAGSTPENETYKQYLSDVLGGKGYEDQLKRQQKLLQKYESEKQSMIETLIVMENVADFNSLSPKAKSDLSYWENNHDPKRGIEDYNSVSGIFFGGKKSNNFMDYNNFIPRRFTPNIRANMTTNQYEFSDTTTPTENYSSTFEDIEADPTLLEFHQIIKEVSETVRENMPLELQQRMAVNTIPALLKTSSEIIADKNTGILSSVFLAFKNLLEKIRLGFGVIKQSEVSYAVLDPITGKSNYRVNDQFLQGNTRAVKERTTIEKAKFMQAFNEDNANSLFNINRFTILNINRFTTSSLILLAQYGNIDISLADIEARNLNKITDVMGDNIEIGKYIRDFSLHSVVQSQSFDLAKIGKYYANMSMMYAARQEALPLLEIMKEHYETIKKPVTNNLNNGIYNANSEEYMKDGVRTNAMRQMDDWFERVALDNYGTKHLGPHGMSAKRKSKIAKIDERLDEIKEALEDTTLLRQERLRLVEEREKLLVERQIPNYGKTIYSEEDKRKLGEIETLLQGDLTPEKAEELLKIKQHLGKARTATAIFDNILSWIRTMRLGYNVSSAITNFLEGVTSNMILSSSGEYFDPKEIFEGYSVMWGSFVKNLTFGTVELGAAGKNRNLMDKFNVIMDSKNELQKSSVKTYTSKLSWLAPHELNQRVEFINQSPIMIAMLRTMKIKDKAGNESSIWDAYNNEGHLKDEFQTDENIENWEEMKGNDYLAFKQKLQKAITVGHGNYHELRGMMIKSSSLGKALMMFKTWVPMQFYWRFASEQDDIQSGKKGYKGRYWSYGAGTGAVHFGVMATAMFGPLGAPIGAALGAFLGHQFGTDSGVGFLKEMVQANKQLLKKVIGMPVNLLAGKQIIGQGDEAFSNWVGQGEFTETDAKNLRANMADLSIQLAWLALILLVKGLLWDDDDEPGDPERIAHNILVNRLMTLSSQASMYINPVDTYKGTIGSNAVAQYLEDVGKEVVRVSEYIHGRDIIQSGNNAGESGLWNQTKKTIMPGLFKDKYLGFETQAERVFEESPFHPYFKGAAKADQEGNKRDRAEKRLELEEELNPDMYEGETEKERLKARDKVIREQLDEEFPTPTKLKKLGLTREEYDEIREAQQQEQP